MEPDPWTPAELDAFVIEYEAGDYDQVLFNLGRNTPKSVASQLGKQFNFTPHTAGE
jgi:hypothetical protein